MNTIYFAESFVEPIVHEFYELLDYISNILFINYGHQIDQFFIGEFVSYACLVCFFLISLFTFWLIYKVVTWVFDCFGR